MCDRLNYRHKDKVIHTRVPLIKRKFWSVIQLYRPYSKFQNFLKNFACISVTDLYASLNIRSYVQFNALDPKLEMQLVKTYIHTDRRTHP